VAEIGLIQSDRKESAPRWVREVQFPRDLFVSSKKVALRSRGTNEPATMAPKLGLRAGNLIDLRSTFKENERSDFSLQR
jgi:hypothetical protein